MKVLDCQLLSVSGQRDRMFKVRYSFAGSTGRRNTGGKFLCWGFQLQGLAWSFV